MPLSKASAENAQPGKIVDETDAAPDRAADTDAADAGAQFEHGGETATPNLPKVNSAGGMTTGGASGPGAGNFGSLDGKLGFGSFPQVKLDKADFVVGDNEGELKEFDFHAMGAQSRWIYKADKDTFFFTYDGVTSTAGQPISEIIADWKAQGKTLKEKREYQEVYGHILNGEFAHRMVILSVPPASVPRLSGLRAEIGAFKKTKEGKPCELNDVAIRVSVGPKITTKAKDTFYPWAFAFKSLREDYTEEATAE